MMRHDDPAPRAVTRVTGLSLGLWWQALLALGVAAIGLMPPVRGPMLLVPLARTDGATTFDVLRSADARLLARGPFPGSYVVEASRAALFATALRHGMLVINTEAAGCSVSGRKK